MTRAGAVLAGAVVLLVCACGRPDQPPVSIAGGNSARGAQLIDQVGCGACHRIPGLRRARGLVGPPLDRFSQRTVVAGVLAHTPQNLIRWLQAPQSVIPGNAMPDMGLSEQQARDIAAYLEQQT